MRTPKQDAAIDVMVDVAFSALREGKPRRHLEELLAYVHELEEKVREHQARERLYLDDELARMSVWGGP